MRIPVHPAGRSPRLPLPVAGLLASALLFPVAGCGGDRGPRSARVPVTVATVERSDMPLELVATGTLEPVESANVGSQVGGVVTALRIREGDEVRAGQALIQLDARPFQAAVQQAQGVLARDRSQWEVARAEAERARVLYQQQVLSQAEWDQKRHAAEALRATVSADSANLAQARLDLQFATIRSPIAGRTGDLKVNVGDLVKAGTSEPLVTVNRMRPMRVVFTLAQGDLPLLQRHRAGHPRVRVRLSESDTAFVEGRLVFVDNAVDAATGTVLLKGELPNEDGRLWPGGYVETHLVLTVEPGVVVAPSAAVTTGQQGTYVYVLGRDSTVTSRPVRLSRVQGDRAIVREGLQPGEVVITDGQFRLAPGSRVVVRRGVQDAQP